MISLSGPVDPSQPVIIQTKTDTNNLQSPKITKGSLILTDSGSKDKITINGKDGPLFCFNVLPDNSLGVYSAAKQRNVLTIRPDGSIEGNVTVPVLKSPPTTVSEGSMYYDLEHMSLRVFATKDGASDWRFS